MISCMNANAMVPFGRWKTLVDRIIDTVCTLAEPRMVGEVRVLAEENNVKQLVLFEK